MPRNGSGTYSLPAGNPVVTGTTISSTTHNTTMSDLATAITASIAKDGQTTPTANLPMGGYKHTGVAVANATTDYARADQVQNSAFQWLTSVSGADTITAAASITPSAYAAGQAFRFVSAGANTTAVTLNVSSLGAKSVTKNGTTALAAGDIPSGAVVEVVYDGTRFQLLNVYINPVLPGAVTTSGLTQATGKLLGRTTASTGAIEEITVSGATLSGGTLTISPGKLVQYVNSSSAAVSTGTTTIPKDDTIPQNTEGDQYLSVSITPTSSSNKLLIIVNAVVAHSAAGGTFTAALFQDSTANALAAVSQGYDSSAKPENIPITYYMTAGTTSATTFKVRVGSDQAGTTTFNGASGARLMGGVMASSITIMELA